MISLFALRITSICNFINIIYDLKKIFMAKKVVIITLLINLILSIIMYNC